MEGGAKGWKESPKAPAPPQQQQAKKPEVGKATYVEKLAASIAGQNKKDEAGFQVVGRKKEKKEEKNKVSGLEPIPTNKNTLENRRITFRRNNDLPVSLKKDLEIVSEVNRALWARQVPAHIRMTGISTNMRGSITALARENASADMLIAFRKIIVIAARKVDQGIIDIEKNETWERVKMHRVNFDQYMAKRSGGLEKLREEIHAENEGVIIPMAIRWMGRVADIKEKKKSGEKQASSVVFAIKGKKMAQRCLEKGLRAAGVWHEVERYVNSGPETFCESCGGGGHHVSKCGRLGMVRCMLCAGTHKTEEHQCDVVGCKAKKGQNCNHNANKCANCKGGHIAKSNECPKNAKP
jgi:hypothetical protein